MSTSAFVSGALVVPTALSPGAVSSFTGRRTSCATPAVRAAKIVTMIADNKNNKVPQGFTLFSEQLNGRAAMAGFFIALATEMINQDHPGIVAQVQSVATAISHII
jgi:hypothetical protein